MHVSGSQMRYRATMGAKAMTKMTEDHHRHRPDATLDLQRTEGDGL
jgi:hypothetical protein